MLTTLLPAPKMLRRLSISELRAAGSHGPEAPQVTRTSVAADAPQHVLPLSVTSLRARARSQQKHLQAPIASVKFEHLVASAAANASVCVARARAGEDRPTRHPACPARTWPPPRISLTAHERCVTAPSCGVPEFPAVDNLVINGITSGLRLSRRFNAAASLAAAVLATAPPPTILRLRLLPPQLVSMASPSVISTALSGMTRSLITAAGEGAWRR
jgi:hypothetical protein